MKPTTQVVPEASARIGQRNEESRPLMEDHRSICRFATADTTSYRRVLARLEFVMGEISPQAISVLSGLDLPNPASNEPQDSLERRLRELNSARLSTADAGR